MIKRIVAILFVVFCFSLLEMALPVNAISEGQEKIITEHCDSIRSVLKNVQRKDAKSRVFLGEYYDAFLDKFITPLNVRLVENNLSTAEFVENQNSIVETKALFVSDFVNYQQDLEELVLIDCKNQPEKFYEQLVKARQKRKIVEQDTLKMRNLLSEHIKLADQLKRKL